MKKIILFFTCLFIGLGGLNAGINEQAIQDYTVNDTQGHVLEIANSLPMVGVLTKKKNGYVYLKISQEYITKIFPNLILDGHLRPTTSFGSEEGAHITVFKETENSSEIDSELGKEFTFEIKEIRTVRSWKYIGKLDPIQVHSGDRWVIAVESADLEELRMRCGLSPLVDHHDFHISIGFEVPFNRIYNFGEHP